MGLCWAAGLMRINIFRVMKISHEFMADDNTGHSRNALDFL